MDKFLITGPCQIKGKVTIAPSKNAAIPILAATLLFDKPVVISNLPKSTGRGYDDFIIKISWIKNNFIKR